MTDDSILKLGESIDKYAASAISTVPIPQFKGLPNEDIHEFLSQFKLATIMFTDEVRCLAIYKALAGSAHTWAKENIKVLIKDGNWKAIKKLLIERFSGLDQQLRYQKKLLKMNFDSSKSSLLSYIEEFVCVYRKAHTQAKDCDIIKSLSLNLPPQIIKHLNLLSDLWTSLDDLKQIYTLVRRLEEKILPYEDAEAKRDKANLADVKMMLKELQESQKKLLEAQNSPKKDSSVEAVAAIGKISPPKQPNERVTPYGQQNSGSYRPNRGRYRGYYNGNNFGRQVVPQSQFKPMLPNSDEPSKNKTQKHEELKAAYEAIHGKIPGPCYHCGGDHFNVHCPYLKN